MSTREKKTWFNLLPAARTNAHPLKLTRAIGHHCPQKVTRPKAFLCSKIISEQQTIQQKIMSQIHMKEKPGHRLLTLVRKQLKDQEEGYHQSQ